MGQTRDLGPQPAYIITHLVDAATILFPMNGSVAYDVTITGNRTIANPTNPAVGYITLIINQGAGGNHLLTYGSAFTFPNATPPTLSTNAGAVDLLFFFCDGTNLDYIASSLNVAASVAAPTNLTATNNLTGQVNLAWTNNASDQTGTDLQMNDGIAWSTFASVGAGVNTYSDMEPPGTYTYRVIATRGAYSSLPSNTAIGVSN